MRLASYQILILFSLSLLLPVVVCGQVQASDNKKIEIIAHRGSCSDRPENTMAAFRRAIEVGATAIEIDIRTSADGRLVLMHDKTVDRTTDGTGNVNSLTWEELNKLDAGSHLDEKYQDARIPQFREVLELCKDKIDLLLDLKESGPEYHKKVAEEVKGYGNPDRIIAGARSVEQAKALRKLLPGVRLLGFIPSPKAIEAFGKADVQYIRLWQRWIEDDSLIKRVRSTGAKLHINLSQGDLEEYREIAGYQPDSILADDPALLISSIAELNQLKDGQASANKTLSELVEISGATVEESETAKLGERTFLNRDYKISLVPDALSNLPRIVFAGGEGQRLKFKFKRPAVMFAVFEYNKTGNWSFEEGRSPTQAGWHLLKKDAYQGTSNSGGGKKPRKASIYFRQFKQGESYSAMPNWWINLGIVDLETASSVPGFQAGLKSEITEMRQRFSYEQWATTDHSLSLGEFVSPEAFRNKQDILRTEFIDTMLFSYDEEPMIRASGVKVVKEGYRQQEYEVVLGETRLFRFFKLTPANSERNSKPLPTVICFMGHGKVSQILEVQASYQHACAAQFAKAGFLVFAMENVGMEPGKDTHQQIDRLLRLDGQSWYSLLFAHQRILIHHVFSDKEVDTKRVGAAGVSTGGLLALSAAAMEPRIAAATVQGIFGRMRVSFIQDRSRHCNCGAIPGMLPRFDLPDLALLVAPRSLHISNAANDGFSPAEAKLALNLITPNYLKSGGKKPLFTVPQGHHEFAFAEALSFFKKHLAE